MIEGLTLREYLAGQAMSGLIPAISHDENNSVFEQQFK